MDLITRFKGKLTFIFLNGKFKRANSRTNVQLTILTIIGSLNGLLSSPDTVYMSISMVKAIAKSMAVMTITALA